MKAFLLPLLFIFIFSGCVLELLNTVGHIASGKGKSIHTLDVTKLETQGEKDVFLRQALREKDLSKMKELVDVGANVDTHKTYYGGTTDITPIVEVCNNIIKSDLDTFSISALEFLLANGANPNQKNPTGESLITMIKGKNSTAIDILIKYGAK